MTSTKGIFCCNTHASIAAASGGAAEQEISRTAAEEGGMKG